MTSAAAETLRLGHGTLLAIHAHPDDETLTTGGLLARWRQAGGRTVVVTATRGEQGETIGDELAALEGDPVALAALRSIELSQALQALGVSQHCYLDQYAATGTRWVDSGMQWQQSQPHRAAPSTQIPAQAFTAAPLDELVSALSRVFDEVRPQVVVTYGPDGGYGHPDHIRVHEVVMSTVQAASQSIDVLWRMPDRQQERIVAAALEELWQHLVAEGLPERKGHRRQLHGPLPQIDASQAGDGANVHVHVHPVVDQLAAALRAHRSQVQCVRTQHEIRFLSDDGPISAIYALSNGIVQAFSSVETYRMLAR